MPRIMLPIFLLALITGASAGQDAKKAVVPATGWGSLSGKIVDSKGKPIPNVAVWLKAPADRYFPIHADDRKRGGPLVITFTGADYSPHVAFAFPAFFDGKAHVETEQALVVRNADPKQIIVPRSEGGVATGNAPFAVTVLPGKEHRVKLTPQRVPLVITDCLVPSAQSYLFPLDHPYAAVTSASGEFTIPRVPAGANLAVVAWQEDVGYLLTKNGENKTFRIGENRFDLKTDKLPPMEP